MPTAIFIFKGLLDPKQNQNQKNNYTGNYSCSYPFDCSDAIEHGYFCDIELIVSGYASEIQSFIRFFSHVYYAVANILVQNRLYDKCIMGYEIYNNYRLTSYKPTYSLHPIYSNRFDVQVPKEIVIGTTPFQYTELSHLNFEVLRTLQVVLDIDIDNININEIMKPLKAEGFSRDYTVSEVNRLDDPTYRSYHIRIPTHSYGEYYKANAIRLKLAHRGLVDINHILFETTFNSLPVLFREKMEITRGGCIYKYEKDWTWNIFKPLINKEVKLTKVSNTNTNSILDLDNRYIIQIGDDLGDTRTLNVYTNCREIDVYMPALWRSATIKLTD